jgi:hypothetical protein
VSAVSRLLSRGRLGAVSALVLVAAGLVLWLAGPSSRAAVVVHPRPERHPQTVWAACNRNANRSAPSTFTPRSDAAAAALVTPEPETRPDNARPYRLGGRTYPAVNFYVPSAAQVRAARRARVSSGETAVQFDPYYAFVDGRDGLNHPSTDDLIQWAAHKWGIPENWLRAEYVHESYWNQFMLGDDTPVSAGWYRRYPSQARSGGGAVYQSMGITQVRWAPDGSLNAGSEPLRWLSTAFNVDWQAATLRFYYDNPQGARKAWNDPSYRPCQGWNSIGAWYRPYPWNNPGQHQYASDVRAILHQRGWTSSSFLGWSPGSLPPGIRLLP